MPSLLSETDMLYLRIIVTIRANVYCNVVVKHVVDKCPYPHSMKFLCGLYRDGYIYVIASKLSTSLCCSGNTIVDLMILIK